jgi:hypothetical protein
MNPVNYRLLHRGMVDNAHKAVSKCVKSHVERHLDNIYLNVVFENNTNQEIPAVYSVTKTIPLLDKPSEYYLAIIRMDVPLNGVPLLVMPIIPNQVNSNLTPFVFGINGFNTPVIYVPDNNNPVPVQNQPTQVITPYYYVFSYQNVLDAFNTALAASYVAAGAPGAAGAPFFIFNPVTQLISLIVATAFIAAPATVTCNIFAINYLEGFRFTLDVNTNTFTFVLENTGNNGFALPGQTLPVVSPPTHLAMSQEYITMEYWLNLRKIVLTSNTIPINPEYIPAYDSNGGQSGVSLSKQVLTDFVPSIESSADARSVAVYNPSAQYRLIDMIGDLPLINIDLQIYWSDKFGNYYPLMIEVLQQASVKIGFLRRDLYHA